MYWTDLAMQSIEVSELDGSSRRVLFTGLNRPRAITTHYPSGRLFWTDWDEQYPRIEAADMDGNNRCESNGRGGRERRKGMRNCRVVLYKS